MERDRGFNFKLLVPPRMNYGQVSAVRPQGNVEKSGDFMNTLPQGYTKCFDKEQSVLPNTGMVAPSKPSRYQDLPKMKAVPPLEKDEINCNPGQLYSKLLDEVEKIKCWKTQVDTDTVQKERKLQENKRTIETQRKAIQELQFGNESLSIKMEEQICENEDLRNRNNATRNLCNILKDTFQRSTEKMHLFESEREETNHIFMENNESIQKLISAFESLRVRAEADRQEMQRVKEDLLQIEELKDKYQIDNNMKEKEVAVLQTKVKDKESELQKLLLDLHEIQKQCKQLQETTSEQRELLHNSKTDQESLLEELHSAEQRCKETQKNSETIAASLEKSKEEYRELIQSQVLKLEELTRVKTQQAEKLEQIQATVQELQNSLAFQMHRSKELDDKVMASNEELEKGLTLLEETIEQSAKKDGYIKTLQNELDKNSRYIDNMKTKIDVTEVTVEELTAELSRKTKEVRILKNEAEAAIIENDLLKKACETAEKTQGDLKAKAKGKEIKVDELKGELLAEKKKTQQYTFQMEQLRKDITHHETKYKELLSNFNELQSEKNAIQQQFESGSLNVKAIESNIRVSEEKAGILRKEIQRLEEENQCLRAEVASAKTKIEGEYLKTETVQKKIEADFEHLQQEVGEKEKQIKAVERKLCNIRKKLEMKHKSMAEYQRENKMLKKQMSKSAKSSHLEDVINGLNVELDNLKRLNEEDRQTLLKELESNVALSGELNIEVQKLKSTALEAVKNKEDAELKCQHKIADMVVLMEKHKSQYDRMVEEKVAELDGRKKKETEAVACRKSLELDLEKHKQDHVQLKQQLKIEVAEKEKLQKELSYFNKELSTVAIAQLSEVTNKQSPASNHEKRRCSETPQESSLKRHVFDFSKSRKTPVNSSDGGFAGLKKQSDFDYRTPGGATAKIKEIHNENPYTPRNTKKRVGGTAKIKSYRIRTPPAQTAHWEKSAIDLDPKSDSSDQNDILSFASKPAPNYFVPHCTSNILQKIQSPVNHKSPGNSLKLAAMKRMRDAGWTAVTGCGKKKKKNNEKIFA